MELQGVTLGFLQPLGGDAARAQAGGAQALEEWVELQGVALGFLQPSGR